MQYIKFKSLAGTAKRICLLTICLVFGLSLTKLPFVGADGLSQDQIKALQSQILYFNTDTSSCTAGGGLTGSFTGSTGTAAWSSTAQPPYFLEEFAINVLEDLAQTTNTPQANTLTQQHVLALVAWFWAEGGDIANSDLFNPLNGSYNLPGSTVQSTGNNAYPSFNVGVQATVLTFLGSFQNRIAGALVNATSSANQVMQAITYYQNYPGNKAWAEADTANQQQYLNNLLASVQQATTNYNIEASTEMGTPQLEQYAGLRVPATELKYGNPSMSSSTSTSGTATTANNNCGTAGTPSSSSSGYQNPLRSVSQLRPERIDQGVDYAGQGPVYALGNGTIVNLTNTGWFFGGYDGFIAEQLSDGPAKGDYVYVAEGCPPVPSLQIGQQVTSSTVICNMINPGSTGIETGWASPPGNGESLARASGQWDGSDSTAFGTNYSQLLQSLMAPGGVPQGTVTGTLPSGWPAWK